MHCIATHSTSQHIFLKLTTLFATYLRLVSWTPSVPETPSFNSTNINIIAFHLCAPPLRAHFHCALTVADYAPVCNIHLCSSLVEHKRWWWLRAIISLRSEIYWVTHNHTIHMSSWVESDTTTFVCNPFVHCYCKWILKITLAFVGCRIEAICIYHKRTVETRSRVTQSQWTKHRAHTHTVVQTEAARWLVQYIPYIRIIYRRIRVRYAWWLLAAYAPSEAPVCNQ